MNSYTKAGVRYHIPRTEADLREALAAGYNLDMSYFEGRVYTINYKEGFAVARETNGVEFRVEFEPHNDPDADPIYINIAKDFGTWAHHQASYIGGDGQEIVDASVKTILGAANAMPVRNTWLNGGDDTFIGSKGDDQVWGGRGDDTLIGNDGNDYLNGQSGANIIDAGRGNDHVVTEGQGDIITLGQGQDVIEAKWIGQGGEVLVLDFATKDDALDFSNMGEVTVTRDQEAQTITATATDGSADLTVSFEGASVNVDQVVVVADVAG